MNERQPNQHPDCDCHLGIDNCAMHRNGPPRVVGHIWSGTGGTLEISFHRHEVLNALSTFAYDDGSIDVERAVDTVMRYLETKMDALP